MDQLRRESMNFLMLDCGHGLLLLALTDCNGINDRLSLFTEAGYQFLLINDSQARAKPFLSIFLSLSQVSSPEYHFFSQIDHDDARKQNNL